MKQQLLGLTLILFSSISTTAFAEPTMTSYLGSGQKISTSTTVQNDRDTSIENHGPKRCGVMEQLKLTPEQKEKIKTNLDALRADWEAKGGKNAAPLTPKQRKATHEEMRKNLQAILTPEQFQKFETLTKQCHEKHKCERQGKNKA